MIPEFRKRLEMKFLYELSSFGVATRLWGRQSWL